MGSRRSLVKSEHTNKKRQFYGRRLGRPLNESRRQALEALSSFGISEEALTQRGNLEPASLFDTRYTSYWLEIGFGAGEHLAQLMRRHPNTGFLGAEPYINGMSSFLKDVQRDNLTNARVSMDDAIQLVHSLKDESLDGIYILNPDPWHKKRHHKRRIVRPETLDHYARILKPGGQLILSTDVPDLADWMMTHTYNHGVFEWMAQSYADWSTPPHDWITTAYEVKGAKGAKKMSYLVFERG